jgi:hypothetical protein
MESVFTSLYENKNWGDNNNPEYSGSSGNGSEINYNKDTYVPFLKKFIIDNNIKTVIDLGCGDFKCGRLIYGDLDVLYTGYDAYKKIVDYNLKTHFLPKYSFIHLDFCNKKEDIVSGDLCILKDVLQHWSLKDIYTCLDYLSSTQKFKYILICNCCNQYVDNTDINNGYWRQLSSDFFPLKKYNAKKLYNYDTKEVSVIYIYPKNIYFCNKTIGEHDIASANKWKELNPEYEIKLYDDEMIRTFLLHEYGTLFKDIFDYIPDGPIKSDFWRVCILYKYGGVYSDIDNVPLVKMSDFIDPSCDLITCSSYISFLFNPNFIVSCKGNIILKRCIEWYILKYANINKNEYKYWDWSVMNAFTQNLHLDNYNKEAGIYNAEHMRVQIIKEFPGKNYEDAHNIYNNIRIFNNRQPNWDYILHKFK